jgi:hypothetical protein
MRDRRVTQNAFERLELYAVKAARTVLRRVVSGNRHRLSDCSSDTFIS